MTLSNASTFSALEFNNFDTMSYNTTADLIATNNNHSNNNNDNVTVDENVRQRLSPIHQPTSIQQQPPPQSPQTLPESSPPLALAHVATASATIFSSLELGVENVMPGIYLSKNFIAWNEENLRSHGFTHIIIIDKHIQELYYPSPIFKLSNQIAANANAPDPYDGSPFDYICHPTTSSLSFSKDFEVIDLNFGEKSYLTTVLPNCYRAVKFINKALQSGGTILVIDCNGGEQKCLTIIVAYLMYKHNISFRDAFERLKSFYKKADLDRFYTSQLYEYEPILQVQRAQSRGHSCSRELHSAILKRKKVEDDITAPTVEFESSLCLGNGGDNVVNRNNDDDEFFHTLNPLSHFNTTPRPQQQERPQQHHQKQQQQHQFTNRLRTLRQHVFEPYNESPNAHDRLIHQHYLLQQQPQHSSSFTIGLNDEWDDYCMD